MLESSLSWPTEAGGEGKITVKSGDVVYILGANGSGKSGLLSHFTAQEKGKVRRISAHRQNWLPSNVSDITPHQSVSIARSMSKQDAAPAARWKEDSAAERASLALFDVVAAENAAAREIANAARKKNHAVVQKLADEQSPLTTLNEIFRLSNLPIELSIGEESRLFAAKNGGTPYSAAELSDGERNAFILGSRVLTAGPNILFLIDEPERHLHRSIIVPLLSMLFRKRKDCGFIISTHDDAFPEQDPGARTMLVRSCTFNGPIPSAWTIDMLDAGSELPEETRRDLIGARRRILFVEGEEQRSLDQPLYTLLFPQVSVISKQNCRDVERAVFGLRGTERFHWGNVVGIVDRDHRSDADVQALEERGVWALSHYSVESLYFHPKVLLKIAERQSSVVGNDPVLRSARAARAGVAAIGTQREHLVSHVVQKQARDKIMRSLPSREQVDGDNPVDIRIDVKALRKAEYEVFDALVQGHNLEGLLSRYPVRESPALDRMSKALGLERQDYHSAVLKLLQEDVDTLNFLRSLFGSLPKVLGVPEPEAPTIEAA